MLAAWTFHALPDRTLTAAPPKKFPYEAVVDLDDEPVRCGAGPKYYPTDKLARGTKITVVRHDPGGWAMIQPPPGSFSWVQAEYVRRDTEDQGVIDDNGVIVHVGSRLSDDRSIYQRTLSRGDRVKILGDATFETERGPVQMFKIAPPLREFRWIATKAIVPAAAFRQNQNDPAPLIRSDEDGPIAEKESLDITQNEDPFAPAISDGNAVSAPARQPQPTSAAAKGSSAGKAGAAAAAPVISAELKAQQEQLIEIDRRLREMVQSEPRLWELALIQQDYTQLGEQSTEIGIQRQIQQRLRSLQRYQKIQRDYQEFYQLTTAVRERDAQLLSLQRQNANGQNPGELSSPVPIPETGFPPNDPFPGNTPTAPFDANGMAPPTSASTSQPVFSSSSPQPVSNSGRGPDAAQSAPFGPPAAATGPGERRFAGAGLVSPVIVPRGAPPQWVLVAPDGRLLAHLQPSPGVQLTPWVNRAVGVIGQRSRPQNLSHDVIVVQGLQPVQLRGTAAASPPGAATAPPVGRPTAVNGAPAAGISNTGPSNISAPALSGSPN
jgi:hypothetical protein